MAKGKRKHSPVTELRLMARQIMTALGKGHTERVYHRALITLFNKKRVAHRSEVLSPIYFMGEVVGFGRCDLIVKNMIVELKANKKCPAAFSPQLDKYMASMATAERRRYRGVILNFNQRTGIVEVHQASTRKKKEVVKKPAVTGTSSSNKRSKGRRRVTTRRE
jgi:GxxExxY protein